MALFNYATKEITIKVVYYGPGLSGKTTNLQYLHSAFEPSKRGKLLSLATEADRTLFFDFLPIELGKISDFSIRFQLYTVPGQVRYNATRRLVLKGADAVVFVADSQREMREQNIESLTNMRENLIANNIDPDEIPVILQYNKRDLANILSIDQLNSDLNAEGKYEYREAIAIDGTDVEDTFQHVTRLVIKGISEKHKIKVEPAGQIVNRAVEEAPRKRKPIESITLPEMEIGQNRYDEKPETILPETSVPEGAFRTEDAAKKEVKGIRQEPVVSKEIEVKESKEIPALSAEKLELIVNGITEMTSALKELKNAFSDFQAEIRDMKKEQKDSLAHLREITDTLDNIKTKKRWFSFS
jgi:hypothetical protein